MLQKSEAVPRMLPEACYFIKKKLWHKCLSANFAKYLKNSFFSVPLWATASEK